MTDKSEEPGIEVVSVGKTFLGARKVHALAQLDFSMPAGQFISILGPSGCGKSTLLRLIAGLLAPDEGGVIRILGRRHSGPSSEVGVVFQTHNLLPWLTVEKNLRLAAEIQGLSNQDIDERVAAMLPTLGLQSFRRNFPHELSGGMKQRTALGQTLVLRPKVLLLDEPFGALDALTRDKLNIELLRLWQDQRKTVLLITHSISEAVFLSDRILVMSSQPGRIIEDAAIELPRPRDPQVTKQDPEFTRYLAHFEKLMGIV